MGGWVGAGAPASQPPRRQRGVRHRPSHRPSHYPNDCLSPTRRQRGVRSAGRRPPAAGSRSAEDGAGARWTEPRASPRCTEDRRGDWNAPLELAQGVLPTLPPPLCIASSIPPFRRPRPGRPSDPATCLQTPPLAPCPSDPAARPLSFRPRHSPAVLQTPPLAPCPSDPAARPRRYPSPATRPSPGRLPSRPIPRLTACSPWTSGTRRRTQPKPPLPGALWPRGPIRGRDSPRRPAPSKAAAAAPAQTPPPQLPPPSFGATMESSLPASLRRTRPLPSRLSQGANKRKNERLV